MRIGTKVSIKDTCNEYRKRMNGCVGYVKATPITIAKVGIKIPGYFNGESDYGYFWFCPDDLNVIREPFKSEAPSSVSPFAIKNVYFNDPVTVVMWQDGTKTIVRCDENDIYDPEMGLAMAISKKALGNKGNYYNQFKKWLPKKQEESKPSSISALFNSIVDQIFTDCAT